MILEAIRQLLPSRSQLSALLTEYQDNIGYLASEEYNKLLDEYESLCVSLEEFRHLSRFLLEYTWENLHTGHWKDVHLSWRVLYAGIRIVRALYGLRQTALTPTIKLPELLKSVIEELDYSLLMGYPVLDGVATRLASLAHEQLTAAESKETLTKKSRFHDFEPVVSPTEKLCSTGCLRLQPLDKIFRPSLERFQEFLHTGRPFILTGGMTHWPACRSGDEHSWTIDYWQHKVGHRLVPVEIGSKYTDESWGQELVTINQFIERFIIAHPPSALDTNRPIGYLAQHQLFLQIPELADDVHTPDYCMVNGKPICEESCVDSNVWFGPANTVSPLHHDNDRCNLLAQVAGFKYVILYTASETPYLYAHTESMLCNTSQADVEHPDLKSFPLLANAQGFHGILGPGEMLFIPPRCWHHIRSLSLSFSVNFWWDVAQEFIPPWPVT